MSQLINEFEWTEEEKAAMRLAILGFITPDEFAKKLEDCGAIKRWLDNEIDKWELEDELEFRGRWADDGGSLEVEN